MAINLDTVLKLPLSRKIAILCVFIVLLSVIFYFEFYSPKQDEINNLKVRLSEANRKLEESRKVARELEDFKKQVEELTRKFSRVLTQLPNDKEIPGLLTAIANAGRESGLEFLLFKPNKDVPRDFYAEVPVKIEVTGGYHNLAVFFEKVKNMPRIVNISNIKIGGAKDKEGKIILKGSFLATTFRFLPQNERKNRKKKGRRR